MPPAWWPAAAQRALLQACLTPDAELAAQLRGWEAQVALDDVDDASFPLLPYLYARVRRADVDARDRGRLKGIYARQWYLARRADGSRQLPDGVATAGVVALRGEALARAAYGEDAGTRGDDDAALLVPAPALSALVDALAAHGTRPTSTLTVEQAVLGGWPFPVWDPSGTLALRTRFADYTADPAVDDRVRATAAREVNGDRVVASAEFHLLDALMRAGRGRADLRWALDAALVARLLDESGWARVVDEVDRCGWRDRVIGQLRYLHEVLDAAVPPAAVATVARLRWRPVAAASAFASSRHHRWSQRAARAAIGGYLDSLDRPHGVAGALAYPVGNARRIAAAARARV